MAQVAQGPGWSGGSLPVRAHDLLLSFAGQVDDDALADARELLAAAEVDRTLDFLVGCLVAGHIPISAAQRGELDALSAPAYLDRSLFNRLIVDDSAAIPRHRFAAEVPGTESAAQGVTDAAHRVLDALPDVRSVWAVWRLTPAGAVSGPVPHRVVLVGVGPAGFPTATAYRLEHTLRRVGVRASVEALRDGAQAPDYHHTAMQYATQVPFGAHAAIAPARPAAQLSASRLPAVPPGPAPRPGPPTATRMPAVNPPSMPRLEQPSGPRLPAPVNPPSVPRLEPPSRSRMPVAGPPSVPRLEPPSLSRTPPAPPPNRIPPGPPSMSRMP
ncbi:hypothetical protein, partial [Actinophytocola sp.]|uniref:hypothetical protein n=1 Tax=Actinophytocola sp. TaxID=1872138 RepID=UPI002D7E5544